MEWKIKEYQEWINNGMPINTHVNKLYLYYNKLTTLPESISNLTQLTNFLLLDLNN